MTTASKLALIANHDVEIVNVGHVLHGRIVELKTEISRNALALGEALAQMRDHELYRALGYPNFEDYLVSAEVAMHRTTAYSFMRIYQRFREVQGGASKLDSRKLDILTQIIKEGDPPERILPMLEEAATISRAELLARVRAGKQQRMIAPAADVQYSGHGESAPDVVHELHADVAHARHDHNEATTIAPAPPVAYERHDGDDLYPPPAAPEWTRPVPIEASYAVAASPDPWDAPPSATPRANGAVQAIIASGRDDYIAQDFNKLVAYLLGSTDIAPRVVRNFATHDVARILTRDEVAGLRRAIPVLEFALGVYADFERQNLRVVR